MLSHALRHALRDALRDALRHARRTARPARRGPGHGSRPGAALLCAGVAAALLTGACGGSAAPPSPTNPAAPTMPPGPSCIEPRGGGACLEVAPADRRVDLTRPSFSNPTSITNPTHPSSKLDQVIYGGQVDGKPFRTEFTRLPETRTIAWDGGNIETVAWQYLAFSDGRIQEVAIDWFAQDDAGAVWYFGEDVADYSDGVVASHEGTWLAGRDGPPGMIQPANPQVGDVYRPENVPGLVFEEVTIKAVGQTVRGPSGPVGGAVTVSELHDDGTTEGKVFAPGFGEFSTGNPAGELEAATLAVPTDARPGPAPAELTALAGAARTAGDAVGAKDWAAAASAGAALTTAWDGYRGGVGDLLAKQMTRDLDTLRAAVAGRHADEARGAALRVAQNALDLRLRSRPVAEVDAARLDLWARQVLVDAAARDAGSVSGDVAALELTRDRVRHTLDPAAAERLDTLIGDLRRSADGKDVGAAAAAARKLVATLAAG